MKRKFIPLIFMLIAGAFTVIITAVRDYPMTQRLVVIFAVMLLFFLLGSVFLSFLNAFERDIRRKEIARLEAERQAELARQEEEEKAAQAAKEAAGGKKS